MSFLVQVFLSLLIGVSCLIFWLFVEVFISTIPIPIFSSQVVLWHLPQEEFSIETWNCSEYFIERDECRGRVIKDFISQGYYRTMSKNELIGLLGLGTASLDISNTVGYSIRRKDIQYKIGFFFSIENNEVKAYISK